MEVNCNEMLTLNGVPQFVALRAEEPGLPLLLYLHGGPGDAALPLVLKYNGELARHFTLAVWEQRGAGKSYYPFTSQDPVAITDFVEDARCLIQLLLRRFGEEKVYLVGHSWGSVLGLTLCRQYPELVHTYIGCGQVVDMRESSRLAYRFAVEHATGKAAARLAKIDPVYEGEGWLDDLLFVTGQVVKYGGSFYGASNYNRMVLDFLRSKEYSLRELLARQKGALQSIQRLWQELMGVSFLEHTAYEMPVVLIEGAGDRHVSSALAKAYFDRITSEKQFYMFERACHFPQWSQAERFNRTVIGLLPDGPEAGTIP